MVRDVVLTLGGCAVFFAITFFEQIPVWGWLGGVVSVGVWWLLAREMSGTLAAAIMGAVTGLVGAFTAWLAQTGNLFGFTTPAGDRLVPSSASSARAWASCTGRSSGQRSLPRSRRSSGDAACASYATRRRLFET